MDSDDSLFDGTHSVTRWIEQLKQDDRGAAEEVWRRYFQRLLPIARAKLKAMPHRTIDEEDILVSVFDRFFEAAKDARFSRLHDRDDLWQILLMLTERKVADQYRKTLAQKRGGGNIVPESALPQMDFAQLRELADQEPGPEFVTAFNENLARAITRLTDEKIREVALMRLDGHTNREIADRLDISLSSVERKLRVIREVWEAEFGA